jgi:hypothetical protein
MINDLITTISTLQHAGHTILLKLDSNAQIQDDPDLPRLQSECDLHDLHQTNPAPSTYIGSESRRIDHMFGCSLLFQAVTRAASLSYLDGPQSDHRGLYVDVDPTTLLGHSLTKQELGPPNSRSLKSENPVLVAEYHKAMHRYYADHNMVARIHKLAKIHKTLSRSNIKKRSRNGIVIKDEQWHTQKVSSQNHISRIRGPQHSETRVSSTNTGECVTAKQNTTRITQQPLTESNNLYDKRLPSSHSRSDNPSSHWNKLPHISMQRPNTSNCA